MRVEPKHGRYLKSTRYNMYRDIFETCEDEFVDDMTKRVLCISGDGPLVEAFPRSRVEMIEYPAHDVCNMPEIPTGGYEYVICDQVLEHVVQPFHAVDEMHRVLVDGGLLILTTVFMYPIHEYPKDYWRFTPDALRLLCRSFSEILRATGWGNQEMVKIIADRRQANLGVGRFDDPQMRNLMDSNNPDTPLVTWVVARK